MAQIDSTVTVQLSKNLRQYIDNALDEIKEKFQWHKVSEQPLPLGEQVLVYSQDGSYNIATKHKLCVVVGNNVPIVDSIVAWMSIPNYPDGIDEDQEAV